MFQVKPYQNGIPVFAKQPKWIQSFFKFGKLPAYLFNALQQGITVFQPAIEEIEKKATSFYGQELRKILYSACDLKTVKEVYREGMKMKEETL